MKDTHLIRLSAFTLIISVGVFTTIAISLHSDILYHFDIQIITFIQGLETNWLTNLLKTFTWIGSKYGFVPITVAVCILLFFKLHRQADAIFIAATMISTTLFNEGLKRVFMKERPEIYRIMDAGGYSFPSGHTMMAVSVYALLLYAFLPYVHGKVWRLLFVFINFLIIFLIAVSRIYLGVHFPSDIIGGFFLSLSLLIFAFTIFYFIKRRTN